MSKSALIISVVAIAFSAISLYYTHFQPADIDVLVGEECGFAFDTFSKLHAYLPVVLINKGAKDGLIQNAAILIKDPDLLKPGHLIKWSTFAFPEKERAGSGAIMWNTTYKAQPFTVSKHSSVSKMITFVV